MARSPGTLMEGLSVQPSMGPRWSLAFPSPASSRSTGGREIATIIEEVVQVRYIPLRDLPVSGP